jgi:hypothetical protein
MRRGKNKNGPYGEEDLRREEHEHELVPSHGVAAHFEFESKV